MRPREDPAFVEELLEQGERGGLPAPQPPRQIVRHERKRRRGLWSFFFRDRFERLWEEYEYKTVQDALQTRLTLGQIGNEGEIEMAQIRKETMVTDYQDKAGRGREAEAKKNAGMALLRQTSDLNEFISKVEKLNLPLEGQKELLREFAKIYRPHDQEGNHGKSRTHRPAEASVESSLGGDAQPSGTRAKGGAGSKAKGASGGAKG